MGSHNLSKAAWGCGGNLLNLLNYFLDKLKTCLVVGRQPSNVELGVVLSTLRADTRDKWRARMPYIVPSDDELDMDFDERCEALLLTLCLHNSFFFE